MRSSISKVLTFTVLAATLAACGDSAPITAPAAGPVVLDADGSGPDAAMASVNARPVAQGYLVSSGRQ